MRRRMTLRLQLLLLQVVIVVVTVAVTGWVAATMQAQQIRQAYQDRMIGVAQSVARLPTVREAYDDADPSATIQPIAELIRKASDLTYVVVTDRDGIRFSHPDPARIGEKVSTDPSVPLSGKIYVGTQTGTLGTSWRVKVPVFADDGSVMGTASVGILEAKLKEDLEHSIPRLLAWLAAAGVVGTVGAWLVARLVWRRIHRLEPEEIAGLLKTRDAMLHGIGEGVIALDQVGRVVLVNDEARRLLDLPADVVGRRARDVLEPLLLEVEAGDLVLAGERLVYAQRSGAQVDGRDVGSVIVLRDRTELHTMLRQLDGARDTTQALRAQAHEFSNRMHVICGLLELEQVDEAVAFIQRSSGTVSATAELERPVGDPELEALLLAKATMAAERAIELVVDPSCDFNGDGTSDVVTIVGNLVDNAIDAIGSDGRIEVVVRPGTDGGVLVRVDDDGPGVPVAHRDHVLRTGWSSKAVGTRGIGLALVNRIARRRGSTVLIGDSPLGGARFEVELRPVSVGVPS